ncbi:MAG: TolC family protein [Deltaproteobacteria bacterium]|nr:TolC family protein [Deltaproteobacteria bacterium]
MKRPCLWFLGMALLLVPGWPASICFAAEGADLAGSYRETPNSLRLFIDQWTPQLPPTTKYTLDFLRTADEQTATLTLREAVLVGLENNPGIEVARLEPFRAAEQTMIEKSIFDPTLNMEFDKNFTIEPKGTTASTFFQPIQATRNRDYNLSLKKLLRTGAQVGISFLNNRFVSSLPNQVLKPQYRPQLGFTLLQPLLRDFGLGLTTIFVRIAENRERSSVFDYQARLAQLIQRITEAYWAVTFAKENLRVQQKGVELADALSREAEARVRAGVLPPVAVLEARAEKARREERVIEAENGLAIARSDLRLTLNLNPERTFLPRKIEPAEAPSVVPVPIEPVRSRETALTRRPEVLAADLNVQNQALQLRYAENQLLPRLDLKAGAGLTGLAGDLKPGQTNPFPGNYGTAVDRLGSGEFYNYSVGIVLQFPLGNGQARGNFARTRIELDQAKARLRDLVSQVTLDVEKALADVETNFKRIQSTRQARELAEENLRGQEKRFAVGLVTQKDVIDFQSRFLEAQGAEVRAVTDYNNSISRLRLAQGTLLDYYNVRIEGPRKEADPWWARF